MARSPTPSMKSSAHGAEPDEGPPTEQTPLMLNGNSGARLAPDGVTTTDGEVAGVAPGAKVNGHSPKSQEQPGSGAALPKMQIFLLCYARMMEPIAFFSIFPYIAQMVHRVGNVADSDVGFYSGLIESLFSATQMLVLIFWGRMADRLGRKPVLLCSLVGMAAGPVLFNLSTSIWQMLLFRCFAGAMSGSTLIIRTMIAENSTPETQARAFSWFAFSSNCGIFLGPIIGGALADPVEQYPSLFRGSEFFQRYPYALSGFVTGAISATGAITSALFLEETLTKGDDSSAAAAADSSNGDGHPSKKLPSTWELIRSPGVAIVLWVYTHIAFLAFVFTAIVPVALYTPVELGGFGFGPSKISAYMAAQGASQAMWLVLAFPFLQRRYGTKGVLKGCGIAYPFFFAGYIIPNLLLREGSHTSEVLFWITGGFIAFIGPGVSMSFTASQLALNDVAPDHHVLGTLNAIGLTAASGIRSVIPGIATSMYAVGVRNQILGGHLVWVIMIPFAAVLAFAARRLPEGRRPQYEPVPDEEEAS
ncbi:peptide/nitrate transporter-like protein [Hapsidospora chrysogenum ATCC 11550]|uniref:Peptide/nitrate transporter-like protein n=1 Tax=Hapsidospora chrysogenum (strain ATCC 11550 / CBS 779.69 / DSM 880 / IAM 14645 / JCM 23072 / IMI 49137) TaxID=857340 RepID=A0A086SZ56_HAPC1|nr:peptide/nitrate transporter-like protein [Hapsidospora chrysogenum ATCC 11550]